ncbi:hypothetical protein METEAL_18520 [Mesoterricola silvestris]|uniref:Uncharacterized protein n=1 Tax=Mesoterricola silvestris TaxID=2927979 RepID=A0AA48H6D5_9BACT|nr:hypothetical protein METEAL_18520 [Mesoterricola silvestris]
MSLSSLSSCVLSPHLVVYCDEEIVSPRLKRFGVLIPFRPGEKRPPGEAVPRGIRKTEPFRCGT